MTDPISRQEAIEIVSSECGEWEGLSKTIINKLKNLPLTTYEISYAERANAMLKMWTDNVVTDGEYNRIMDRLNSFERKRREVIT